jgi:hypothetical protein
MLRLAGVQAESLFDEALPVEVRELPEGLARLDALLADRRLLEPIERAWEDSARDHGRPTIAMASFVRLMVIRQRTGWGYESLVREVSDSLHLRRFCLISLSERVPDESTIRKLCRRLGGEVVDESRASNGAGRGRTLTAESFHKVKAEATRWLWDGRIPLGTVTLRVGREKLGKSTLCVELAARLSRGELEGDLAGTPIDSLLVSYEDSSSRTIKPQLMAAGADLGRVHRIVVTDKDTAGW